VRKNEILTAQMFWRCCACARLRGNLGCAFTHVRGTYWNVQLDRHINWEHMWMGVGMGDWEFWPT